MINTISLNNKNYSTVNKLIIDNDLYDVNDFIVVGGRTYYANKNTRKGVSKTKRSLVS